MATQPADATPPPEEKIETLNSTLRCFVNSLIGLVPVIGLPFSVGAMNLRRQILKSGGASWNPAARYLRAAGWLAPLGFLSSAGFLVAACAMILSIGSGGAHSGGG